MAKAPTASRPYMPGYGIVGPDEGTGLLPWSWAEERLTRSHDYWVTSVWPEGRPHVMPVWGVWLDGELWFSSSPAARKVRNLTTNPNVAVATDDALNPVIVHGTATVLSARSRAAIKRFAETADAKYDTNYGVEFYGANACVRVRPSWVFGLREDDFSGSPTRWSFT
jgi:hypothetical protein